jgi:tetratricopeptide (TPR) repeat protein
MDHQEQAFLTAALSVGDERLERRLLVGFHLVRDCCRLADDPTWMPRLESAREAMNQAIIDGTFVPGDIELVALAGLLKTLGENPHDRRALYARLLTYGIALVREASVGVAYHVFGLLDRLWQPECAERDRMEALFYSGLTLLRGTHSIATSEMLPVVLALHASANGDREFLGLAMMLRAERTLATGNLPAALRHAERLTRWLRFHPSLRVEGLLLNLCAVIHGRAGHFEQVLRYSHRALESRFHFTVRLGGLHLAANALLDLGDYLAAQAAFELLLLSPTQTFRRFGWLGLLDVHARMGEQEAFERIFDRLNTQPLLAVQRIQLLQMMGRGWARLAQVERARAAYDHAFQLAKQCGYGFEIIETEQDLARLDNAAQIALATDVAPDVAARVTALRDEHAESIAACMA